MNVVLLAILIALVTMAAIWSIVRGRSASATTLEELALRLRRVDLLAFRNLIDPSQEDFLRSRLRPAQFRRVQRLRYRAAMEYVRVVAHNAAVLLRFAESARHTPDPTVAAAAADLVNAALEARIRCVVALCKLAIAVAVPTATFQFTTAAEGYDRLCTAIRTLTQMRDAPSVSRVMSML